MGEFCKLQQQKLRISNTKGTNYDTVSEHRILSTKLSKRHRQAYLTTQHDNLFVLIYLHSGADPSTGLWGQSLTRSENPLYLGHHPLDSLKLQHLPSPLL